MKTEFLGGKEYGGWETVTHGLTKDSVVYSFGVGEDLSWDLAMTRRFGCTVHAFDPNPVAVKHVGVQVLPRELVFTAVGLATYDGVQEFWGREGKVSTSTIKKIGIREALPVKTLATLMRERGHDHIDVLKVDIEGAEFFVLPGAASLPIRQILVEMHTRFYRFGLKGLRRLLGAYLEHRVYRALAKGGFTLVASKGDDLTFYKA